MFRFIQERRTATLLGALFIVCFSLMTISVRRRGGETLVEQGLLTISGPLMEAASFPNRWVRENWRRYLYLRDLREENTRLSKEVASLRNLAIQARELEAEVRRLKALLGGSREQPRPTRLARIVGRSFGSLGQTLIIDLGSADGVDPNMPVLNEKGIVGRIFHVGRSVSQILLLTDSRSAVDVLFQRSRSSGVFSMSPQGKGEVRYVPVDGDVQVGDLLISSGLGGIFPKGLPVARVTQVGRKGERLFRRVEAEPLVDFRRLEEVLVMMAPQREEQP